MWRLGKVVLVGHQKNESEITGCSPNVPLLLTYICFFVVTLQLKVSVFTFLSSKSWCTLASEAIWQLALSSVLTGHPLFIDVITHCSGKNKLKMNYLD